MSTRRRIFIVIFGLALYACGDDDPGAVQPIAIVSAFPAEQAPLREAAQIQNTKTIDGHIFRIGTLGGAPIILGLTGIGLLNAQATTRVLLDNFPVSGIVMSAVAGSTLRIGDVTVPDTWRFSDGTSYPVTAAWLTQAAHIGAPGVVSLQRCTELPNAPAHPPVCLDHDPAIVVGGVGESSDPFGDTPSACQPGGGEVFGCDTQSIEDMPVATDMETAAVAREAAARGIPFIAFRAVSDGTDDPLNLPGFPSQFFAYYRLAARNAAAATIAFLEHL